MAAENMQQVWLETALEFKLVNFALPEITRNNSNYHYSNYVGNAPRQ